MSTFSGVEVMALEERIRKAARACPCHYRGLKYSLEFIGIELRFYLHHDIAPEMYTLPALFEVTQNIPDPELAPDEFERWLQLHSREIL